MGAPDYKPENSTTPQQGEVAADPAAQQAERVQFSFFDAVTPPTMTTENISADAEPVQEPEMVAQAAACDPQETQQTAAQKPPEPVVVLPESLGQRLRIAREARGLRIEDAAQQMKLPLATVQALEADRYERIGEGIYLRGYLTKYLRLLDLPLVLAERVFAREVALPALVASGTISKPRYLIERYSSSALYLVLTAVIVVPAVWLAMRTGFDPSTAKITPLDAPATSAPAFVDETHTAANATPAPSTSQTAAPEKHADETPLVASLAPFPSMKHESAETEPAAKPETPVTDGHALRLTLAEASWVEIVAGDEKLEYGLLPAGSTRTYHSDKTIDVRVGNANGATVEVDGKTQDLSTYRRANVAHFKLASGESTLSHSGG